MSKKKLFDQLGNLFADLEQDASLLPTSAGQVLPGWTWECDRDGLYVSCSQEVEVALGIPAGQFIGQPLSSFALDPRSAKAVEAVLKTGEPTASVNAQFLCQTGQFIGTALHISRLLSTGIKEELTGYRGFVQVYQAEKQPLSVPFLEEEEIEPKIESLAPVKESTPAPRTRRPPTRSRPAPSKPATPKPAPILEPVELTADMQPAVLLQPQSFLPGESATLAVPVQIKENQVGVLELEDEPGRIWTEDERRLVEQVADQLNLALENAHLFAQTQDTLAETESLYLASNELNTAQSYHEILDILRRHTILGEGSHQAAIFLFDREWDADRPPQWVETTASWASMEENPLVDQYPLSTFISVTQLLKPEIPLLIADIQTDVRLDEDLRTLFGPRFEARGVFFVSLIVSGQWLGFVEAAYPKAIHFPENEVRRATALANQAAVSIQNLKLIEEARKRAAQLETAAEIARDTSSTLALDNLLKRTVNLIRERYGYYHASIFLVDESGLNATIRESTGAAGEEMKNREHKLVVGSRSIIGYVTEVGKPLVINDVVHDPIHRPNPLLPDTRAEVGIPLKIGDRVIGALDVQSVEQNAFSQDDIYVLQTLSDQIAVAVDNARSYEIAQQAIAETRQRVQELSILFNVSQALASATMNPEEIANIIARRFIDLMDFPEVVISLVDEARESLPVLVDLARSRDNTDHPQLLNKDKGGVYALADYPATRRVIDTMLPLVIQAKDPDADPAELKLMLAENVQTLVIIPLAVKGKTIGIIEMESWDEPLNVAPEQLNLAMILANAAAVALENAKLYEEQLIIADKLREVDRLKSQFLANMSHELRTPLNSIIGFSRVIIKGIDGPITEMQQQDLSAIYSSGQHLLNLINNILDISKIEAGKMELAFDNNVNLVDLINSCVSTAVGLVKDKPVKLEKRIAADLPQVNADPTRIRQVILNLVSNATKFTDRGTIIVEAGVQLNPDHRPEVIVKVIDSGTGIAPEDLKKLFQPFSQVDDSPTRKTGGSGLGLSISRLLVEMHGGRIGVTSQVGQGSTFWFTMPLPYSEAQQDYEQKGKIILSVDDERQILNLYERYLSDHGYQVIPLSDPYQVLQRAREIHPFAITLDVMMPGKDGWTVLEELKNDPETKDIPVILCTILENHEKGFSLGATDYLTKPILEEDLVKSLNRLNGDGSIQEILVIDDDENDLHLVEKILEKNPGFHTSLAKGGAEGLVFLRSKRPEAVILDLFMPGLDGFMVLETMRADSNLRDVPVIIFTAGDLTENQQKYLSKFSEYMLRKGMFHEEDLLASIDKSLKRFGSSQ